MMRPGWLLRLIAPGISNEIAQARAEADNARQARRRTEAKAAAIQAQTVRMTARLGVNHVAESLEKAIKRKGIV